MNFFSINTKTSIIIFSLVVFVIFPLKIFPFYSDWLLDPELSLRFICIDILIFLFFSYFLLKRNKIELPSLKQNISLIFIVFVFFNAISIAGSINKNESFYELIRLLIFLLFYFCVLILLHKQNEALPVIIKNINISVLIFSAIGFYQIYPDIIDYFVKGKPLQVKLSVSSSLGNKNFYCETLLMALPFTVYGIFIFKRLWRTISIINGIFILLTVFVLQTISVWIGLFAGIFLMLVAYRKIVFGNKKVRLGFVSAVVLVLISASIIIYSKPDFFEGIKSKINITLKYITDPTALETFSMDNNNSTYERFILWRNSFRMIREHPLAGVGLGEWKIHFPKYGMGMAPYMNYGVIRFEMPHNDFLLVACEAGIPALICYIALFVFALRHSNKIIRQLKNEKDKLLMRLMQAGLTGFIIISFFGFPGQRPFTMIFLMLILAVVQVKYLQIFPEKEKIKIKKVYTIFFISALVISGFGFSIGKQRLKAEMHLSNALRAQRTRSWGPMIRETANAKSAYFLMDYTSTPVYWYNGFSNFYSGNQEEAFSSFKKAEKINPYHFNLLNDLGTCYDQQGNHDAAKEYYLKAIQIAPLFPDALINLSVIYYNSGNIDSAYYTISKCILKNQSYNNDLKAILFAKTQKMINQLSDTTLKAKLTEKINDDKWLRSVHEEALKSHLTFEEALQKAEK